MTYEAWRISYQSSEQAARAAYAECDELRSKIEVAEKERDALRAALQHETDCVEAAMAEIKSLRAKIEAMERHAQSVKDDIIDDLQSQFDSEGIAEHGSGDALIRLSDAIAAVEDNFAQPAPGAPWVSLAERMPNPDKHDRVLIYTEGYDFGGEQVFDVKAEALNECRYIDPDEQPETCKAASHWMPHPRNAIFDYAAHCAQPMPTALLVAAANLVAQMEIVSRVGFVDTPNDKDSCAAFCVAEGTWLELMSAIESLASALAAAPEAKP